MQIKTQLVFERSTAGTHFYVETDAEGKPVEKYGEGGTIKSMYIRKAAVNGAPPKRIAVTIESIN